MPSYASFAAAREAEGAITRLVLRITPRDADSQAPTNLTLLGDTGGVLVFGSVGDGLWKWGASATNYTEPVVEDWGTIGASGVVGTAFETTGDIQLTLRNTKLHGQLPNSAYTFSAGSPAMSPVPDGEDIRLSELFQHYTFTNAPVTITLYIFSRHVTTASADRAEKVLFSGVLNGVECDDELLYLDAVQTDQIVETTLPGREIDSSPEPGSTSTRAPIVYGSCTLSSSEMNSFSAEEVAAIGTVLPVVPAVPLSIADGNTTYIYNDCAGPNSGYASQASFTTAVGSTKSSTSDRICVIEPETVTYAFNVEGTSENQTEWVDGGGSANSELTIKVYKQATAWAYVRGIQIKASSGATYEHNAINNDPWSFAELALNNTTHYIDVLINPITPMGDAYLAADCVHGWVATTDGSPGASSLLHFGLWRAVKANWYGAPAGNVYGVLNNTEIDDTAVYTQENENSVDIPISAYVTDGSSNYLKSPLLNWQWKYPNDDPGSVSGEEDVYVRVKSGAVDSGLASIVSVGIRMRFRVVRGVASTGRIIIFRNWRRAPGA